MFVRCLIAATLVATLALSSLGTAGDAPAAEEAKALASRLLDAGAATFDRRDAVGMAATYEEDARIILVKSRRDAEGVELDIRSGREAIRKGYEEVFSNRQPDHRCRNTIEHAERLNERTLLIRGRFALNRDQGDSVTFVQTRVRTGAEWRIAVMQLFELPR
jgi:hypothetical protein